MARHNDGLGRNDLVVAALGVSPIPVVGEICLSKFFYDLLAREYGELKYAGIPAALLTRMGLYTEIYYPVFQKVGEMLG